MTHDEDPVGWAHHTPQAPFVPHSCILQGLGFPSQPSLPLLCLLTNSTGAALWTGFDWDRVDFLLSSRVWDLWLITQGYFSCSSSVCIKVCILYLPRLLGENFIFKGFGINLVKEILFTRQYMRCNYSISFFYYLPIWSFFFCHNK